MMKILSINKEIVDETLAIESVSESALLSHPKLSSFDYIIINGGDGTIRRVMKLLLHVPHNASFILNPTGSFNVIAKLHRVPKLEKVLDTLKKSETLPTQVQKIYRLNEEVFLFSAGNMGDLQHIFLSETLRFGLLKKGIAKYLLAVLFLFPVHLVMTPFMLLSSKRFFIFTPARFIKKFGSFYGVVKEMQIDLQNHYNLIELDGDVVTIKESILDIKPVGEVDIVVS
jgi:hypothetical protein